MLPIAELDALTQSARPMTPPAEDGPASGNQGRLKNLYVIRLDDAVLRKRKFRERNPDYRTGKPCVYVGVTAHDPAFRFKQHKDGGRLASQIVAQYGKYLMRKKYEHLNPVPAAEGEEWEKDLAIDLQRKGYGVWWN